MEKLLEKYLPGYKSKEEEINEARGAVTLQRRHFEWLIDLLASTLQAINASNIAKKKAIEVFAAGLNGTNSMFNRERFIRTAYKKILADEVAPGAEQKVDMEKQQALGEAELDEKKKKQPMKKCAGCGASMPAFFTKCPKCDAKVEGEAAPKEDEKECKKEDKKECKK